MALKRVPEVDRKSISEREVEHVKSLARLRARVIYEVVRFDGQTDMGRPVTSLWWSGLAAGLSLSFSLLAQAALYEHLPDTAWRPMVSDLGYSVGFLMAVLSRQQLFTETTITVILPLFARFGRTNLTLAARMWGVVLGANFVGTFVAALFFSFAPVVAPELRQAMIDVSQHAMVDAWWPMLSRGVAAGFLMAAMVWLLPSSAGAEFHVVLVMTYLIAIGQFAHVVAGSVEAFMLVLGGRWPPLHMFLYFTAPALIGNVLGGTALFALISYAQVKDEM